jgi:hypothetical protein
MARKKTGQKGGQYGNRNAVKHGGYMRLYEPDQRTRRAKVLNHIEASLAVATGPRTALGSLSDDGPSSLDCQDRYRERYPQHNAALTRPTHPDHPHPGPRRRLCAGSAGLHTERRTSRRPVHRGLGPEFCTEGKAISQSGGTAGNAPILA